MRLPFLDDFDCYQTVDDGLWAGERLAQRPFSHGYRQLGDPMLAPGRPSARPAAGEIGEESGWLWATNACSRPPAGGTGGRAHRLQQRPGPAVQPDHGEQLLDFFNAPTFKPVILDPATGAVVKGHGTATRRS
jgi:hypothetical protein